MDVGTDGYADAATNNNNNDNNDMMVSDGEAEIMLTVMDLDNYNLSYDWYAFFQPAAIASGATNTTKPRNNYIESSQGQEEPMSPQDAARRRVE